MGALEPSLVVGMLACSVATGCTTVESRIHGPRFGAGIDLDHNLDVSPRIEAGYQYLAHRDLMGGEVAAVADYSPVTSRVQLMGELGGWIVPFLPFYYLAPLTMRAGVSLHPDEGAAFAMSIGVGAVLWKPPSNDSQPPLEGAWNGYGPGWRDTDVVYPDWMPQVHYLATILPAVDREQCTEQCVLLIHSLMFDPVIAMHTLTGDTP